MMKKVLITSLAVMTTAGLCTTVSADTELTVFAAASMTETLNEIKDLYEEANPDVTLTYNFDSSGTLKTQIEEGADCDLFISAGQKQMNELDITADEEKNPDRLAELLKDGEVLMAMGNSDVPVGQYTQKILAFYGLDEEELARAGKISYGTNVKEVTTQVVEGSVDCGVVYCTDAYSAGLDVMDSATPEMCGQVIYPAAVMKESANAEAAQAFLDYLGGEEAMTVFEEVGFSPVKAEK